MQGRRLQYSLESDMFSRTDTACTKITWMRVMRHRAAVSVRSWYSSKIQRPADGVFPDMPFLPVLYFNDLCQCHSMRLLAVSFRFFGLALLIFVFLSVLRLSVCVFRLFIVLSVCCFAVFHDSSLLAIIVCRRENYMTGKKRFFDVYI